MKNSTIAEVQEEVNAPAAKVWDALVNPNVIKEYMFGTNVVSDWKEGSPIVWKGEFKGKSYEDKGVILKLQPEHTLQYSHFSPLSGQPDVPSNYHTVTIKLSSKGKGTLVVLSQDKNANDKEREESEQNWKTMLTGLKKVVESQK